MGGGIRDAAAAGALAAAGADALVVGTVTEGKDGMARLAEIAKAVA